MEHIVKYALVRVREYPGNNFIVYFENDEFSDFINSFKSFGFGVKSTGMDNEIETFGTFPRKEAETIWDDLKNRLNQPAHEIKITGF